MTDRLPTYIRYKYSALSRLTSDMSKTQVEHLARAFTLSLLLLLLTSQSALAAYHGMIEDGWGERMTEGIANIANAQYDDGLVIFAEYIKAFPDDPAGYFFSAAGLKEKMQKNNDLTDINIFFEYADKVKLTCKRRLSKNKGDSVAKVYLGGMNGYISMVEVKRGNLVTALFRAADAKKNLEAAQKENPDIPDIYFGLGMLYYFSSLKSKKEGGFTGWIITNLITHGQDMTIRGIKLIRKAIDMKSIGADFARGALMWMRLYQKDFVRVKPLAENMAKRFLKDTSSRWILGRVAIVEDDCFLAREWFEGVEAINKKYSDPGAKYPDVKMALEITRLCELVEEKNWGKAKALKARISRWLDNKPKVVIEYQEKENLVVAWKEQIAKYSAIMANAAHY